MGPRELAAALADSVEEAEAVIDGLLHPRLARLVSDAWTAAVTAAGPIDETALRAIPATWDVGTAVVEIVADLYRQGAEHAQLAIGNAAADVLAAPVYDPAAQAYMAEATNRLAGIGDAVWSETRRVLAETLATPMGREDVKAGLERALSISEFRADTIARTELGGAANAGVAFVGDALAQLGVTSHKTWFAQRDPRTRDDHVDADGQTVPQAEPFVVGGYEMMRPLDPLGPAEQVINCRCTMMLVKPS